MWCSKCGARFGEQDVFCPDCGIRVSGKSEAPITPADSRPVTPAVEATPVEGIPAAPAPEAPVIDEREPVRKTAEEGVPPRPLPPPVPPKQPTKRTSAWAVAALVMGIGAFTFLPVLGAVLAIIFAGIGKGSIKRGKGEVKGGGMATAGLVLGIVGLIIPIILAAVVVPIGVVLVLPGLEARDHLLDGVDSARIYYNERGSYAGLTAEALTEIDGTIDFRASPGQASNVVYVGPVTAATVRLYCYSTRRDRFVASGNGDRWRYNFGWHWGPFRGEGSRDEW
jgi:hypothetical protein